MPRPHPPELRQRAVELARLREKPTAQIAEDLGIDSCLRNWIQQAGVDEGRRDGTSSDDRAAGSPTAECSAPSTSRPPPCHRHRHRRVNTAITTPQRRSQRRGDPAGMTPPGRTTPHPTRLPDRGKLTCRPREQSPSARGEVLAECCQLEVAAAASLSCTVCLRRAKWTGAGLHPRFLVGPQGEIGQQLLAEPLPRRSFDR